MIEIVISVFLVISILEPEVDEGNKDKILIDPKNYTVYVTILIVVMVIRSFFAFENISGISRTMNIVAYATQGSLKYIIFMLLPVVLIKTSCEVLMGKRLDDPALKFKGSRSEFLEKFGNSFQENYTDWQVLLSLGDLAFVYTFNTMVTLMAFIIFSSIVTANVVRIANDEQLLRRLDHSSKVSILVKISNLADYLDYFYECNPQYIHFISEREEKVQKQIEENLEMLIKEKRLFNIPENSKF